MLQTLFHHHKIKEAVLKVPGTNVRSQKLIINRTKNEKPMQMNWKSKVINSLHAVDMEFVSPDRFP